MDNDAPTDEAIVQCAINVHCDDDVNIDANPEISHGDDGAWVQAWVYVSYDDIEETTDA